ncbi:MAG: response regulator transcription factor [Dehalococcoidales bacterium]|nr:response regulator transcription factor [Dehalococcoidales bacterium]
MKIVLIENDERTLRILLLWLKEKYPQAEFVTFEGSSECMVTIGDEKPDLIIVDMSLFDDYFDIQEFITSVKEFCLCPLYFLTREDSEIERAQVIEMGVDDCMSLPLKPMEFLARTGALLRKASREKSSAKNHEISVNDKLVIDLDTGILVRNGETVSLTPYEIRLLSAMISNANRVVTRETLMRKVWGEDYLGDSHILKQHIYRLRTKIEENPRNPKIIVNHRGLGYVFVRE